MNARSKRTYSGRAATTFGHPLADFHLAISSVTAPCPCSTRGLSFREFCDIIEIYGACRAKSNSQLLLELDLKDLGWRDVFIVDDNFIGNKKNVRGLLPELADWQKRNGYPFSLLTEASANRR